MLKGPLVVRTIILLGSGGRLHARHLGRRRYTGHVHMRLEAIADAWCRGHAEFDVLGVGSTIIKVG